MGVTPGLPARRARAQSAAGAPEAPSGRPRPGSQGVPGGSSGRSARSGPAPVPTTPGPPPAPVRPAALRPGPGARRPHAAPRPHRQRGPSRPSYLLGGGPPAPAAPLGAGGAAAAAAAAAGGGSIFPGAFCEAAAAAISQRVLCVGSAGHDGTAAQAGPPGGAAPRMRARGNGRWKTARVALRMRAEAAPPAVMADLRGRGVAAPCRRGGQHRRVRI